MIQLTHSAKYENPAKVPPLNKVYQFSVFDSGDCFDLNGQLGCGRKKTLNRETFSSSVSDAKFLRALLQDGHSFPIPVSYKQQVIQAQKTISHLSQPVVNRTNSWIVQPAYL